MKKTVILMVSLMLTAMACAQSSGDAEGLEIWFGAGTFDTELSFQESTAGVFRSNLDFEGDSLFALSGGFSYQFINAESDVWKKLSISGKGLAIRKLEGTVTDADYNATGMLSDYSKSDVECDISEFDYNAGWNIVNVNDKHKLDVLVGYYYNKQEYIIKDTTVTTSSYMTVNASFPGDVAKYESRMRGIYLGLKGDVTLLEGDKLRLTGQIKYIPEVRADGKGDWQLRRLYFEQDCDGDGLIYEIGASYATDYNWTFGLFIEATALETDEGDTDNYLYGYLTDDYNNSIYLGENTYIGQNRCDLIEIDSMKIEARATYVF